MEDLKQTKKQVQADSETENLLDELLDLTKPDPAQIDFLPLKGDKGDKGDAGDPFLLQPGQVLTFQGIKGDTPQKGKDYFTAEEIVQFKKEVTPEKGKDYTDGKDSTVPGPMGPKGDKGDKGDPGKDGVSIDSKVVEAFKAEIEKKIPTVESVMEGIKKSSTFQIKKKNIEGFDMSDQRWHGSGGSSGGSGITSINTDTTAAQLLTTGTSGTNFAIDDNGTGTHTFNLPVASGTNTGKLSNTDWTTFNNKQGAGSYITDLTGDGTASGPGSVPLTLATVNSNVGSFGSASAVSAITVNGKGLVTAAASTAIQIAESQVTNLVSDLAGKQPTGNYITALTGDVTASGPGSAAATLATVNSNVGTFGSATKASVVTVNAKGLVTAASESTVTPAVGSITGLGSGVATFLATPSSANLAAAVTDETGSGSLVFGTAPSLSNVAISGTTVIAAGSTMQMAVPTVDGSATGPTTNAFNSGYSSSAIGDLVYLDSSATWQKTDANTLALYNGLLGIALEVKASANALLVALPGSFVYATAFPTFTIGGPIYMSEVAAAVTQTQPVTTDAAIRVIGWGIHADKMYFNPSGDYITHV